MKTFERLCLDKFSEEVEKRAKFLSLLARECLYLLAALGPETFIRDYYSDFSFDRLQRIYTFLFQREVNVKALRRAFEELVASGFL